jgi:DNA-binding transcriptional regulator YhcF (GntR family)
MDTIQHAYRFVKERLASGFWHSGERMPSLAEMAGLCGVSRATMWKSVALLQKESLLHARQRGAIIAGPPGVSLPNAAPETLTWKRVKTRIGHEILAGRFSENDRLPINKMALRYGVAINTLKKALRQLVEEGLLMSEGRGYRHAGRTSPLRQTVVLITIGDKEHGLLLWDPRTFGVVEAFERECLRTGYAGSIESFDIQVPKSLFDLFAVLRDIENTAGFIINIWNPGNETIWKRYLDLVHFLVNRKAPVVVIDQAGNLAFPESLLRCASFRILRISSVRAGEMAGEFLFRHGHRHVAYLTAYYKLWWAKDRYAGLCRFYSKYGGDQAKIELHSLDELGDQNDLILSLLNLDEEEVRGLYRHRATDEQLDELVRELVRIRAGRLIRNSTDDQAMATIRPMVVTLAKLSDQRHNRWAFSEMQGMVLDLAGDEALALYLDPFFRGILQRSTSTAWVCSEEKTALAAVAFLRRQGVKVPEDISVMGFDNWREAYELQLTSYDFNMDGMVRQALLMFADGKFLKSKPTISEVEGYVVERRTTKR